MEIDFTDLGQYSKLYLGFSGGADSTALAHLLKSQNISFEAVHFHHHLREYSADKDAAFCEKFCKKLHIPFTKVDLMVINCQKGSESIEATARRMRQQWWQQNIDRGNTAVMLAHHKDDQRENFILRSLRGSSATGLTGFHQTKNILGVNYIRPFFHVTRANIITYLKELKLSWCHDESNDDTSFNRNLVRHNIMPELSKLGSIEGLDRTISNTAKDADYLETSAKEWLSENKFTAKNFIHCHDALKARVIRYFFLEQTGYEYYPSHDAVSRLLVECQKDHTEPIEVSLTSTQSVMLDTKGNIFTKPKPFDLIWNWRKSKQIKINGFLFKAQIKEFQKTSTGECFLASEVPGTLNIRNYSAGDRLIPIHKNSAVKVKKLFNNAKLTAEQKLQIPLICTNNEIIWIPSVKRAHFALAKPTDKVLEFTYERL